MRGWEWLAIAAVIGLPQIVLCLLIIRLTRRIARQIDRMSEQIDAIADGIGIIAAELDRRNAALESIAESARLAAGRLEAGDGRDREMIALPPPSKASEN